VSKKSALQSRSSNLSRNPSTPTSLIRPLILEGRTLLRYVLGRPPEPALVRRYVRAVMASAEPGEDLFLSPVPPYFFMRFYEPFGQPRSRRQEARIRRLYIASVLAETTPRGAGRFVAFEDRTKISVWAALLLLGLAELLAAPFRLLVTVTGR